MEKSFGSRLGFLLVSAGCAIGIGNVWRFPFITGQYGGAAFVLLYLVFLVVMGWPVMTMEFAVGRAAKKSAGKCFQALAPGGERSVLYCFCDYRQLSADDVLYDGRRMDAELYVQDGLRAAVRARRG